MAAKTRLKLTALCVAFVLLATFFSTWTRFLSYTREAFQSHQLSRSSNRRNHHAAGGFFVPHVGIVKRSVVNAEGLAQEAALEEGERHREEIDLHSQHQHHHGNNPPQHGSLAEEAATTHAPPSSAGRNKRPDQRQQKAVEDRVFENWDPAKPLQWKARDLYLPINKDSKAAFLRHNEKQQARWKGAMASTWNKFNVSTCLTEVPECTFFKEIEAKAMLRKCCVEHMKMKKSLFYTLDVAEGFGLRLFLDSGTLLSAMRDGGDTLLPWETDIDLGIVGVVPALVSEPFKFARKEADIARKLWKEGATADPEADDWSEKTAIIDHIVRAEPNAAGGSDFTGNNEAKQAGRSDFMRSFRRHLFETCKLKVSKNVSRNGMCMDAHYVYYADSVESAQGDTSRVEIWPFWPEPGRLVHPTRKKLTVNTSTVLPLAFGGKCRMWGRPMWCPHDSEGYLDHEYTADWRWPKTIHWGKSNAPAWRNDKK